MHASLNLIVSKYKLQIYILYFKTPNLLVFFLINGLIFAFFKFLLFCNMFFFVL